MAKASKSKAKVTKSKPVQRKQQNNLKKSIKARKPKAKEDLIKWTKKAAKGKWAEKVYVKNVGKVTRAEIYNVSRSPSRGHRTARSDAIVHAAIMMKHTMADGSLVM